MVLTHDSVIENRADIFKHEKLRYIGLKKSV
jgi:hypothetical protein